MRKTGLGLATLAAVMLAVSPHAADARKRHHHVRHYHVRHYLSTSQAGGYVASGAPPARSSSYGSSGHPVGTVTAPSIGSYYWPSVGVTNAVPTWNNTMPPVRR